MRQVKFRAWYENQTLTQPIDNAYGRERFFGLLDDSAKLMQFTGLLDKEGKEIYEGDIVSYQRLAKFTPKIDVVEWSPFKSTAGFQVKSPYIDIFDSELIEVIGNIYENELEDLK